MLMTDTGITRDNMTNRIHKLQGSEAICGKITKNLIKDSRYIK